MRLVFLDFDGVLNARPLLDRAPFDAAGADLLDRDAVSRVERFCVAAQADIVVSSTWRLTYDLPALSGLLRGKGLATARLLDVTPMIPYKRGRGQEIQRWLDTVPHARGWSIEGMVILDDDPDMLHLSPWLVQTSDAIGFTDDHLTPAMEIIRRAMPPVASEP